MLHKFMQSSSKSEQAVNTKAQKDKKQIPKKQIEITDLYIPVLNKIMTTHEYCVKYNFVAPLTNLKQFQEINGNNFKLYTTIVLKYDGMNFKIRSDMSNHLFHIQNAQLHKQDDERTALVVSSSN